MEGLAILSLLAHRAQRPPVAQSKIPCRFYARGVCREGDNCRFSHVASRETANTDEAEAFQPGLDTRSQVPCHFYLRGGCLKGDKCPYAHIEVNAVEETIPERQVWLEFLVKPHST